MVVGLVLSGGRSDESVGRWAGGRSVGTSVAVGHLYWPSVRNIPSDQTDQHAERPRTQLGAVYITRSSTASPGPMLTNEVFVKEGEGELNHCTSHWILCPFLRHSLTV